jgi:UDP-glucuronate 4-epimerase
MSNKTFLITGAAGFIGFHTSKKLLEAGESVVGYDNINDYYDQSLKYSRLDVLKGFDNFKFYHDDLCDMDALERVFTENKITHVCNLAAQAGVRYSIDNPHAYVQSNLVGFQSIIEISKKYQVDNFVYASSSSVYGGLTEMPFHEKQDTTTPISLYAATKRSNELVAHSYSHLFGLNTTGLRFFTVYGPWGRPDMALFLFAEGIKKGEPINVFNNGECYRDFTYVDDIVQGVIAALNKPHKCEVFNLARGEGVKLLDFIAEIEKNLDKKAIQNLMPLQQGDVPKTSASIEKAQNLLGYDPKTSYQEGIKSFIDWSVDYKV